MDPHTAVGYLALSDELAGEDAGTVGVVLATAHPAKFREVVEPVIGRRIELPPQLALRLGEPVLSEELADDVAALKRRLLDWELPPRSQDPGLGSAMVDPPFRVV